MEKLNGKETQETEFKIKRSNSISKKNKNGISPLVIKKNDLYEFENPDEKIKSMLDEFEKKIDERLSKLEENLSNNIIEMEKRINEKISSVDYKVFIIL
jgi:hypothetical protein